jgi:hypothetical protein
MELSGLNMGKLSPEQKLIESLKLYYLARELKRVSLIKFNKDIKEDDLEKKLIEMFLYARS